MTFTVGGTVHRYLDHPYNSTRLNERAVEVPVVQSWLAGRQGPGLEVGNVLGHYGITGHRVVDLYEQDDGVDNVDVFDVAGRYGWIVAISTVEHVRWDIGPRDPDGPMLAVDHLRSLLAPGGSLIVTVPLGYHPHLDDRIMAGWADRSTTLARAEDGWVEVGHPERTGYGPWANAVWIGEWDR